MGDHDYTWGILFACRSKKRKKRNLFVVQNPSWKEAKFSVNAFYTRVFTGKCGECHNFQVVEMWAAKPWANVVHRYYFLDQILGMSYWFVKGSENIFCFFFLRRRDDTYIYLDIMSKTRMRLLTKRLAPYLFRWWDGAGAALALRGGV